MKKESKEVNVTDRYFVQFFQYDHRIVSFFARAVPVGCLSGKDV